MTDILEMKISFEQGNGLGIEEPDTYAVAGLLAQFFRELPEPLLMYDLYNNWVNVPSEYISYRVQSFHLSRVPRN